MIDVKQAIRNARAYFVEVYDAAGVSLDNLLLEGVEESKHGKYWLITYGFDVELSGSAEIDKPNLTWGSFGWKPESSSNRTRTYHTVWVHSKNGKAKKMTRSLT